MSWAARFAWRVMLTEKTFFGRVRMFGKFLGAVIYQWKS